MKLVTGSTIREMDRRTIEEFHVPSILLMENAALRVVETIVDRYSPLHGKRVAVICGKGNNGGDGLAIGRHLATRFDCHVDLYLTADPKELTGDAAANLALTLGYGLVPRRPDKTEALDLDGVDIIVDALFGTGFRGQVTGIAAEIIDRVNASDIPVVAVDVPSGVDADTGAVRESAVRASLTVTFGFAKIGLLQYPAAEYVGELIVGDIGMPRAVMHEAAAAAYATTAEEVGRLIPSRSNGRDTNKGTFGHVLVFAGSTGFLGAAVLSAGAAARSGAGLITAVVPDGLLSPAMATMPAVIMTRGLSQTQSGTFSGAAVDAALALCGRGVTAVAIGPGIDPSAAHPSREGADDTGAGQFVRDFVGRCPLPIVVDADGLNLLAAEPDHGASIIRARSAATVLTPHPGEMGRLLGRSTGDVQADRLGAVRNAVDQFGCTVLLKGARTLVASAGGPPVEPGGNVGSSCRLNVNTTGNPGMSSGGMGDVMTGVIAALLGSRMGAHEAAVAGAYLHGLAGDLAAVQISGLAGLNATDVIDRLPAALSNVG